jgi:hypothetical protein
MIEDALAGVSDEIRRKVLYENAAALYHYDVTADLQEVSA